MSDAADHELTEGLRRKIRRLYFGTGKGPRTFRLSLLAFDLATIVFFVVSSMSDAQAAWHWIDFPIAFLIALELGARVWIADRPWRYLTQFSSIADILVIISLVAPVFVDNLAFLRVVRMLRLLRSYRVLRELRDVSPFFKRNEEIIHSSINLLVFIFVVTAIVYVVEGRINPHINNYFDALYFTVTTLTTTGFGDITMTDTAGRMLAVVIMILGVALFLRLIQTIFRPQKVNYPCPECGLSRHDPDAVHCKHCGHVLNIPNEGYD
jgi:voltage-gated potassium channel